MIVGLSPSQLEGDRPVAAKINPGHFVQCPGNTIQGLLDQLVGAICRAGVADDPIIDNEFNRFEAAANDGLLISDDHDKANRLHGGPHDLPFFCRRFGERANCLWAGISILNTGTRSSLFLHSQIFSVALYFNNGPLPPGPLLVPAPPAPVPAFPPVPPPAVTNP